MSKTITRLFDSHTAALSAVEELERAGLDHDKISIISNNTDNWHDGHKHAGERAGVLGDRNGDGENDVADGAGKGATTGGLLGGGAGLLAGLGMLAIPGLGPVVAAGWLASTAVGAAIGAAAGGATGGLLGALKEAGHTDDEANVYSEGVRRGGTLVSVKAHDDEVATVEAILDGQRGVTATTRGDAYRQSGWSRFDERADPYGVEEIARERALYLGETRSFSGLEPTDRSIDDGAAEPRPIGSPGLNRPV
ncbi:hypothetical protein ASE17_20505 [Phenylobacterium sp. Root77]|jgi:hypothetical protein|uniref:hypothetical protein n=1 Tax=unclassified Phenylobacterium TaxID=2640670 RepID=UPI0006F4607A|nr:MULTISPECIES: hypothetical protein [unclassified Phenylobacterium]KQW67040.1 hypothetical protein ASC73_18100 [Phenylobacterium sp. Root1277]KQW89733.1 hypothetical protein ASC79_19005 [Phenylobacterium sp. Root1290]KRC43578.1 hypothetical protein ASE17_20505 [Phenylobacterium sp. Root77]